MLKFLSGLGILIVFMYSFNKVKRTAIKQDLFLVSGLLFKHYLKLNFCKMYHNWPCYCLEQHFYREFPFIKQ